MVRKILFATICFGLLAASASVYAQGTDQQEVDELKKQIRNLERRVNQLSAGGATAPAVEQRVTTLEKKMEKWDEAETLRAYWSKGLRFESNDGNFALKVGGRIMNDWVLWDENADIESFLGEDLESGTEFRRARLYMGGEIYKRIKYKAQYEFAGSENEFKDVYMELKDVPAVGAIRVGHFKEPFSLEEQTSSKYITFMERALPGAFVPGRNTGLMFHNKALGKRMTWAAGVFRDTGDHGGDSRRGSGEYNVTGRLTFLPVYEDDGETLVR